MILQNQKEGTWHGRPELSGSLPAVVMNSCRSSYHTEDGSSMFRDMGRRVQSWMPAGLVNCGKHGTVWKMNKTADVVWNKGIIGREHGAERR